MKLRAGFVSNSSSASFVVWIPMINERQKRAILNHTEYAREHGFKSEWMDQEGIFHDDWDDVEDDYPMIKGEIRCDNGDTEKFFKWLGINSEAFVVRDES